MDKYSITVKYWIDNNFRNLLCICFLLLASIWCSHFDNFLLSKELGYLFSLLALILSFYVSIKLVYWLLSLNKEIHVNDYKTIMQLLDEETLTPGEVAKVSNNEVVIYKDYFWLCNTSYNRSRSNKKTQAKNGQTKELIQTKQSLSEYLIDEEEKSQ